MQKTFAVLKKKKVFQLEKKFSISVNTRNPWKEKTELFLI